MPKSDEDYKNVLMEWLKNFYDKFLNLSASN